MSDFVGKSATDFGEICYRFWGNQPLTLGKISYRFWENQPPALRSSVFRKKERFWEKLVPCWGKQAPFLGKKKRLPFPGKSATDAFRKSVADFGEICH